MLKPLSQQERRVLDYIVAYLQTNTYQPSIREIGREFSIKSTKTVSELLQSLADKGWIERDPSRSRGVRLLGHEVRPDMVTVPVHGNEPAADPVAAFLLDRKLVPAAGAWVLRMDGDHLVEEGIRTGDLVVVEPAGPAAIEPGDLVVVSIGGAVGVRRCQSKAPSFVLEATRSGEAPLTLTAVQAESVVQGCATTIIRQLRPALLEPLAVAPAAG